MLASCKNLKDTVKNSKSEFKSILPGTICGNIQISSGNN